MATREDDFRTGLGRYLSAQWNGDIAVEAVSRVPGGASRETWKCTARVGAGCRGLIVRVDPETSLIDTDRATEFRTIEAVYKAGLPVPEPLFLEQGLEWLGRPFSITTEIPGCETAPDAIPETHRDALGHQKWSLLGRIARLDPLAMGLDAFMPRTSAETCALEQLDYWHKVIVDDELHPNPVAHAAIRWLRRSPPPPARKLSLVHGDYRTGNFLFTLDGRIEAILDWEMAHMGDPLEDLAWSLDPLWHWRDPKLAGRLISHGEAVRHWEESSGMQVDPEAFRWWRVFASVKAIGIWISSSEDFHNGTRKLPILAMAGWMTTDRQQQVLVDYLSPNSSHRFYEVVK